MSNCEPRTTLRRLRVHSRSARFIEACGPPLRAGHSDAFDPAHRRARRAGDLCAWRSSPLRRRASSAFAWGSQYMPSRTPGPHLFSHPQPSGGRKKTAGHSIDFRQPSKVQWWIMGFLLRRTTRLGFCPGSPGRREGEAALPSSRHPGVVELAAASGPFDPDWPPAADDAEIHRPHQRHPPRAARGLPQEGAAPPSRHCRRGPTQPGSRRSGGRAFERPIRDPRAGAAQDPHQRMSVARVARREPGAAN